MSTKRKTPTTKSETEKDNRMIETIVDQLMTLWEGRFNEMQLSLERKIADHEEAMKKISHGPQGEIAERKYDAESTWEKKADEYRKTIEYLNDLLKNNPAILTTKNTNYRPNPESIKQKTSFEIIISVEDGKFILKTN